MLSKKKDCSPNLRDNALYAAGPPPPPPPISANLGGQNTDILEKIVALLQTALRNTKTEKK